MPPTDQEWADYLHQEVDDSRGDTECEHRTADLVLIEFVGAMGYPKLAEAWNKVGKWYA